MESSSPPSVNDEMCLFTCQDERNSPLRRVEAMTPVSHERHLIPHPRLMQGFSHSFRPNPTATEASIRPEPQAELIGI